MQEFLTDSRRRFLGHIAEQVGPFAGRIVVLTHILPDRPELIEAIERIASVAMIIAIPYSINEQTLGRLRGRYTVVTPTLSQLKDSEYLVGLLAPLKGKEIVILEIGGYFAPCLNKLHTEHGNRLRGVVEDTEAGHRQYESAGDLSCPVVSVARSSLKESEDLLVGASCLFSVERLVRRLGFVFESKRSLVLGYGRVGRGLAKALHGRKCQVLVYDTNPIRRVIALADGWAVPARATALASADIIFGATGRRSIERNDFSSLKSGAILVSCSSKDVEIDVKALAEEYVRTVVIDGFDAYHRGSHILYLVGSGMPVNFLDEAVIGPVLTLVQAETLMAVQKVLRSRQPGLCELDETARQNIAEAWLQVFCDPAWGFYRLG